MLYLRITFIIAFYVVLAVLYVRKRAAFWAVLGTLVAVAEYQSILHGGVALSGLLRDAWELAIIYVSVRFLAWLLRRAIGPRVAPRPARVSTDDASATP